MGLVDKNSTKEEIEKTEEKSITQFYIVDA